MLENIGINAKKAEKELTKKRELKTLALVEMAKALIQNTDYILTENQKDLDCATENGISETMQDRLRLTKDRILAMAESVELIAKSDDPTEKVIEGNTLYNGLKMEKISVPMGVIGIIYESRPNVTSDCAALCLKAGSAVILRGGKEAIHSNKAITNVIQNALETAGLSRECVQLIEDTNRETAVELMKLTKYVDLLIPRGGAGLIRAVVENSRVPVIETGVGNCHVYVDEFADLEMATNILFNAKCSRPSVCNAAESLVVHEKVAKEAIQKFKEKLSHVKFIGCEKTAEIIDCEIATEEDYYTEYLDYCISVKVVESLDEAIDHITKYSSGHSEAIITNNYLNSELFVKLVDSSAVYVNASTRFTDGGEYGFGAEIGISTQKLHARGPMGLANLVSYKFVVRGNGQVR